MKIRGFDIKKQQGLFFHVVRGKSVSERFMDRSLFVGLSHKVAKRPSHGSRCEIHATETHLHTFEYKSL